MNRRCQTLSGRKDAIDTNIPEFDLDAFFSRFGVAEKEVSPGPDGTEPPENPENPEETEEPEGDDSMTTGGEPTDEGSNTSPEEGEDAGIDGDDDPDDLTQVDPEIDPDNVIIRIAPPSRIRDIISLGFNRMNGDSIVNTNQRIRVIDIIVALPSLSRLYSNPGMIDNQFRIMEMRPISAWPDSMTISCKAFFKDQDGNYHDIYYRLKVDTKKRFDTLINKLFKKQEDSNGTSKLRTKYKSIYVGRYWNRAKNVVSKDGIESPCFITDIFNIPKQIYCDPDDKL